MAKRPIMTQADHARVSAAVHLAEGSTAGEIVTIIADRSDTYRDVALWIASAASLLALGILAMFPASVRDIVTDVGGGWQSALSAAGHYSLSLGVAAAVFVVVIAAQLLTPLGLGIIPRSVKAMRVRARAIAFFKVGAERRTKGRTGVLIYLSMAEHCAEIVADEAIHSKVEAEVWGHAMAHLITEVKAGRIADGMIAAIGHVGTVLSGHFPRADDDVNELPDRLIEL